MFNFPTKTDKFLTVERIYQKTTEAEIFRHFLGFDFKVGELYKSPLRQDDKNPSFNIYVNSQGHLRYKDWGHSQGTCIDFVSHLYNVDFYTACLTINSSMNLGFIGSKGQKVEYSHYKSLAINPSEKEVRCRLRQWRTHDIYYWKYKYYISSSTLSFLIFILVKKFG
jgi:hypothetical protein